MLNDYMNMIELYIDSATKEKFYKDKFLISIKIDFLKLYSIYNS